MTRPRLPRGIWTWPNNAETIFDFGMHAMFTRPSDYSSCTPERPDSTIPWTTQELFKLPEDNVQAVLLHVLKEFVEGRDIVAFLSASGVRYREPLPREMRPQLHIRR